MAVEAIKLQTLEGAKRVETIRNNDRIIFDDASLAAEIFTRLKPVYKDDLYLVGLNERFRFYRYQTGQYFKGLPDNSSRSEASGNWRSFLGLFEANSGSI